MREFEEEFRKEKVPKPLFVLDLVLKPGHLIPQYSSDPEAIVKAVMDIFDEGIKSMQEIQQLEPLLLRHLFRTHGTKMIKAPLRP